MIGALAMTSVSHALTRGAEHHAGRPVAGIWDAELTCPGGAIEFELALAPPQRAMSEDDPAASEPRGEPGSEWWATIRNGEETIRVPEVRIEDDRVRLEFTHYGSAVTARISADGRTLEGRWKRRRGVDRWTEMPFRAVWSRSGLERPTESTDVELPPERATVHGRWSVDFSSSDERAVGIFGEDPRGRGRGLVGTFLTTVGDYRFLGGRAENDGRTLRLSVFDGAHAFLFIARLEDDDTLVGDFWSRDVWHETWTARRDPDAALPDGFGLTAWNEAADLGALRFPTPEGELVALDDPRLGTGPRIIEVFGTWCPNCNDATEYLVELHRRFGSRGLSITGLAFEYTGDFEIDAERVRAYRTHHGIEFPLLVAGVADKSKASEALPILDRVRAYPTMIFMDREGAVRAIYTGFNGPATGELHERLRDDVERVIESMLTDR